MALCERKCSFCPGNIEKLQQKFNLRIKELRETGESANFVGKVILEEPHQVHGDDIPSGLVVGKVSFKLYSDGSVRCNFDSTPVSMLRGEGGFFSLKTT